VKLTVLHLLQIEVQAKLQADETTWLDTKVNEQAAWLDAKVNEQASTQRAEVADGFKRIDADVEGGFKRVDAVVCRGTWARVIMDQFRHLVLHTF
jgi:hypothetical protein